MTSPNVVMMLTVCLDLCEEMERNLQLEKEEVESSWRLVHISVSEHFVNIRPTLSCV